MDYDFLKFRTSWFDELFHVQMGQRYATFKTALNLLYQLPTHNIVETGCLRIPGDWGGGQSTLLFAYFIQHYGGHLTTIDISENNMDVARGLTLGVTPNITYIVNDSVDSLMRMHDRIDFLYLDSMDCPIEGDATQPQEHNMSEFIAAEKCLRSGSVILLDDADFGNGGKVKLTTEYMWKSGKYECILNYQQSLWMVK